MINRDAMQMALKIFFYKKHAFRHCRRFSLAACPGGAAADNIRARAPLTAELYATPTSPRQEDA